MKFAHVENKNEIWKIQLNSYSNTSCALYQAMYNKPEKNYNPKRYKNLRLYTSTISTKKNGGLPMAK